VRALVLALGVSELLADEPTDDRLTDGEPVTVSVKALPGVGVGVR
jgi:hypothetical protein